MDPIHVPSEFLSGTPVYQFDVSVQPEATLRFRKEDVAQFYRVDPVKQRLHGLDHVAAIRSGFHEDRQPISFGVGSQHTLLHHMGRLHRPAATFPFRNGVSLRAPFQPIEELLHRTGQVRGCRVDAILPSSGSVRRHHGQDPSGSVAVKRALVCGAGGFIAGHLVKRLKQEGYWVRGVDIKAPEFSPTTADDFLLLDLREPGACDAALSPASGRVDEAYQLAADMGGMGFIHSAESDILRNNALININMIHAAARAGIRRWRGRRRSRRAPTTSTAGKSSRPGAWRARSVASTGWRSGSRGSRIATDPRAPGPVGGKKRPPRSAARLPRPATTAPSRCGVTARPFAPTPTSMTWSRVSID